MLKLLRDEGYQVERAFLPDDVEAWKKDRVPLYTYETERPVGHFPTIGVSLAHELELAGLIEALKLAGIPPLRRDRGPGASTHCDGRTAHLLKPAACCALLWMR